MNLRLAILVYIVSLRPGSLVYTVSSGLTSMVYTVNSSWTVSKTTQPEWRKGKTFPFFFSWLPSLTWWGFFVCFFLFFSFFPFNLLFSVITRKENQIFILEWSLLFICALCNASFKWEYDYLTCMWNQKLHNSYFVVPTCIHNVFLLEQWECCTNELFLFNFFICIFYMQMPYVHFLQGFLISGERGRSWGSPYSFLCASSSVSDWLMTEN